MEIEREVFKELAREGGRDGKQVTEVWRKRTGWC